MDPKKHYVLFMDESGTHNYKDADSTIFGLGGCIFNFDYYQNTAEPQFNEFKKKAFGSADIILHYADYVRNRMGFERLKDAAVRHSFYRSLNETLHQLHFTVIACRLDKPWHWKNHGTLAHDPYHYALECIVERFAFFLKSRKATGTIITESRTLETGTNSLDSLLEVVFLGLKIQGTYYVKAHTIKESITGGLLIRKKKDNIAGLQIADSIITPIVRRKTVDLGLLEKRETESNALDFKVIEGKFRKNYHGEYKGFGLVDLPKEGI